MCGIYAMLASKLQELQAVLRMLRVAYHSQSVAKTEFEMREIQAQNI